LNKSISVIVPTYNEKDNVKTLVEEIDRALSGYKYEIILVDDNSRDGTIDLAHSLESAYPVKIIVRQNERGLATAVAEGFKHAVGDIFVVMDADLQHPPDFIPSLIKGIEDGADISISSRYVSGGGTKDWSLSRRVISKGAIFISHLLLPASRKVKDITTGFFALKREVVQGVDLKPLGWKILLEVVYMGKYKKVVEVPFVFTGRTKGKSKLNVKQEVAYLKHIWSLMKRKGELWRFVKFCLVGGSGVVVNLGVYWLLTRFANMSGNYLNALALSIAFEASVISNFTLNDFFTFTDRKSKSTGNFFIRFLKFNLFSLVGYGIQQAALLLFFNVLGWNDLIAVTIGIIIATIWNYVANSWWTWK
jgi:dolichol-phosphate mannosyltransferase